MIKNQMISERRNYKVINTEQAKCIVNKYLIEKDMKVDLLEYGLPEIVDRYHVWNVPILYKSFFNIGEIVIDAKDGSINLELSSDIDILNNRILNIENHKINNKDKAIIVANNYLEKIGIKDKINISEDSIKLTKSLDLNSKWLIALNNKYDFHIGDLYIDSCLGKIDKVNSTNEKIIIDRANGDLKIANKNYNISPLNNMIIKGKCQNVLSTFPIESIDLIFTSPPYYNARKQYSEYETYDDYLNMMRKVIRECKRVLMDGKFFVMNTSHVMIPRASRSESSQRIAVPFDLHQIFIEEGFEFVDDIIWQKPEGAGWASGRGRRFSADRNAMQYKSVPVTEYVMVYRKKSKKLIDYFIRKHPNQEIVNQSKITGDYDVTNIWYISPARDKRHPAIFPQELAERVIKYYSFKEDMVLDPFGGLGTTAKAAIELGRKFCTIECSEDYIENIVKDIDSKYRNLTYNIDYEYRDLSNIDEVEISEDAYTLKDVIKELIKQGIDEEDIIKTLENKYKIK